MKKMLIVDDNVELCIELTELFSEEGFLVDNTSDSLEGAALIKKNMYDICIIDYKMKDFNGIELLKMIKNVNPRCAVFIVSGRSSIEKLLKKEKVSGLAAGIINKPFNIREFIQKIKAAL